MWSAAGSCGEGWAERCGWDAVVELLRAGLLSVRGPCMRCRVDRCNECTLCAVRCGPSGEPHAVEGGQGGEEGPGLAVELWCVA